MIKTYTYKLKPNKSVEQKFLKWVGVCRFVYNCSKDLSEQSYRAGLPLTGYDISTQLTPAKKDFPWVAEVGADTLNIVISRFSDAMKKFFKGAGYPRWASQKNWRSIPFKKVKTTHNSFKLEKFGIVKVFKFKQPKGILRTACLVKEANGIYLKVVVKEEDNHVACNTNIVGIDMGIKAFMTTSDGVFVDNPKHLSGYLKKLRIENRTLSRMKKGGSNYKKQVNRLQRLYQKITRVRLDFLHKESTKLAKEYGTVVRENLNVAGMAKNSKLSKHILDCGWAIFFSFLEYKTNVVEVKAAYSSQECSKCGHTCKENRRTQSQFECIKCFYAENADLNAAFNLLQRGRSLMGVNARH